MKGTHSKMYECKAKSHYRLSDVIAAVCLPVVVFLYVQLSVLQEQILSVERGPSTPPHTNDGNESPPVVPPIPKKVIGPPINMTSSLDYNVLLYTPILESGSTSFRNLLGFLKSQNNFKLYSEPPRRAQVVHISDEVKKETIVRNLTRVQTPTAFVHSFAFIDFNKYGARQPIQVTVARDPLERLISLFYRARSPYQLVETKRLFPEAQLPTRNFLKKSIEACLDSPQDLECRYIPGSRLLGNTIQFFCGHHPNCLRFGSEEAYKMAVDNVEKSYAIVGLLEYWPMTLAVLERYVPLYFNNATFVYYDKIDGHQSMMNENFYKPKVDTWAREALGRNLTQEVRFYNFLRERLLRQYHSLSL